MNVKKRTVQIWLLPVLMLILTAALAGLVLLRHRAVRTVTVSLPDVPVTINGQQWDNRDADYPLLSYHDTIYLPAPAAKSLGLKMERTQDAGLSVSVTGIAEDYTPQKRRTPSPERNTAAVFNSAVTVAGTPFDNDDTLCPFLEYRGVPYLPLTEALCTGPLCLDYERSAAGLSLRTTGRLRAPTNALPRFIRHMGGVTADGRTSTNSIEAAEDSYRNGYCWLEMDFSWTLDGALVCVHDWGNWRKVQEGVALDEPLSLADFERVDAASTVFHSFTPEKLGPWLKAHTGAMIVTDVKEDNLTTMRWLAEHYPDLRSRLVVQIYDFDEYEPIHALGYDKIILTMYRISWKEYHDFARLHAFIRDTGVLAIAMPADENIRDVFEDLIATGIPVYVHTLNDPGEQEQWLEDGAYGFYTDRGDVRPE